jgi:hypothetical protein
VFLRGSLRQVAWRIRSQRLKGGVLDLYLSSVLRSVWILLKERIFHLFSVLSVIFVSVRQIWPLKNRVSHRQKGALGCEFPLFTRSRFLDTGTNPEPWEIPPPPAPPSRYRSSIQAESAIYQTKTGIDHHFGLLSLLLFLSALRQKMNMSAYYTVMQND